MRIVYIQYSDPAFYPPLEHSSRIFADRGWKVLFLGIGVWGAPEIKLPEHKSLVVRYLPSCKPGIFQKVHYLVYCVWVMIWIAVWRPRWAYLSDTLACPIAWLLSFIPGLRIIYHEHDSPAAQGAANTLLMHSRNAAARRAWLNILPNQQRLEMFRVETGTRQRTLCVWNCPRRDEATPQRQVDATGGVWVLYQGSLSPDRLPVSVLAALAMLPETVKLRVIGYEVIGSAGYIATLQKRACELGVLDRVDFPAGPMSRSELLEFGRKSDIGLSFMPMRTNDINMRAMTGASNKAFDYLACGLALLVSDLADWRSFFVAPGYGLACDPADSTSIANSLSTFLGNLKETRAMGEKGRRRVAAEWNYETQFEPVLAAIQSAPPR